ncbi:MAG: 2-oxo acid dehydrogenase subunit E2, partial [bacterium]|nr:2-oxo acid dehydrogenase subunit E2 [bacterium]
MFSQNVACRPLKKISTWRRISMAVWERPGDPSVYGTMEIDAGPALKFLEGKNLTITHLIIKAVAKTLAQYPQLNVIIRRNRLYVRDHVDLFVQVFFKEKENPDLSGAKIRNAHQMGLEEVAKTLTEQSQKIRSNNDPNLKTAKSTFRYFPPLLLKWIIKATAYLGYDLNISPKFLGLPPDPFGAAMITNVGMFGLHFGFAPLVPFSRPP